MNSSILRFPKFVQLRHVAAELMRADACGADRQRALESLERGLQLLDVLLTDPKWKSDIRKLLVLREEVGKAYEDFQPIRAVLAIM